jgi:hypothetical protein
MDKTRIRENHTDMCRSFFSYKVMLTWTFPPSSGTETKKNVQLILKFNAFDAQNVAQMTDKIVPACQTMPTA